jgi:hypothetical protein
MIAQAGYSVAGRLGGTVCGLYRHKEMRSADFLVEPQNHWDDLSVVWPQNHWDGFLQLGLKTGGDGFIRFGLKTGGSGFLVWASKPAAAVW